jgi:hypothetical protein
VRCGGVCRTYAYGWIEQDLTTTPPQSTIRVPIRCRSELARPLKAGPFLLTDRHRRPKFIPSGGSELVLLTVAETLNMVRFMRRITTDRARTTASPVQSCVFVACSSLNANQSTGLKAARHAVSQPATRERPLATVARRTNWTQIRAMSTMQPGRHVGREADCQFDSPAS